MNRIALALTLLCACDGPNIDGKLFKCQTHADCGAGYQCVKQLGSCVQADNNVNGVFSDRLVLGMSAALDETTAIGGIGAAAKRGILTYFNKVNNQGGVNGRRLELISEDDKYDATQTTTIVSNWTNGTNRKVFGVIGVIGTEPSLAAREVLIKNKVLFYAPATGYEGLEPNPPDRYVFNTRVRYNQEAEQLTAYAINTLKVPPQNVAVFGQGTAAGADKTKLDAFGISGLNGAKQAINGAIEDDKILATSHKVGTADASVAIYTLAHWLASTDRQATGANVLASVTIAALPDAATAFICGLEGALLKNSLGAAPPTLALTPAEQDQLKKVKVQFVTLSVVGAFLPMAIGQNCKVTTPAGDVYLGVGSIVAQSVPDPASNATGVIEYREQLKKFKSDATPDPLSLEGYVVGGLLVEGLKKHGTDLTVEAFIDTMETLDVDLGIGTRLKFSSLSHQAMTKLWAVQIQSDLTYKVLTVLGSD